MILANEVDGWGAWAVDASFMLSIAASNCAAIVHSSVSDTKVSTMKCKNARAPTLCVHGDAFSLRGVHHLVSLFAQWKNSAVCRRRLNLESVCDGV